METAVPRTPPPPGRTAAAGPARTAPRRSYRPAVHPGAPGRPHARSSPSPPPPAPHAPTLSEQALSKPAWIGAGPVEPAGPTLAGRTRTDRQWPDGRQRPDG